MTKYEKVQGLKTMGETQTWREAEEGCLVYTKLSRYSRHGNVLLMLLICVSEGLCFSEH